MSKVSLESAEKDNEPTEAHECQWFSRAISIGELRDVFLVAIGLTYLLGYLLWSNAALVYGLGFISIIDYQYLSAGFIFSISLSLIGVVLYWSVKKASLSWLFFLMAIFYLAFFGFLIKNFTLMKKIKTLSK